MIKEKKETLKETKEALKEKKEILKKKIDESQAIEKGKKRLFGVIYGRTAVIIILLLLQILMLFLAYQYLQDKGMFLNAILRVFAVVLVIHIINCRENPAFMISWIILILGWPVFGTLLYVFVALQPGTKWINKHLQNMHIETRHYWMQNEKVTENLSKESMYNDNYFQICDKCSDYFENEENYDEEYLDKKYYELSNELYDRNIT